MARGDKSSSTDKQMRIAGNSGGDLDDRSVGDDEAGGGYTAGSGHSNSHKTRTPESTARRRDAAKRGWVTRRKRLP